MKNVIYTFLFLCFFTTNWANPLLEKANDLYKKEQYDQAIIAYEKILENNQHSVALYYNLANAHYKLHHIAPSIYYYEKALLLDPDDADVKNNLSFAQAMAIDEIKPVENVGINAFIYNLTHLISLNYWAYISIVFAVIFIVLFAIYYFSDGVKTKRINFFGMICTSSICILSIVAGLIEKKRLNDEKPAIVFSSIASVKNEPNKNAEDAFVLHEGTKVMILEGNEDWIKISIADGSEGWINSKNIKALK